MDQFFRSLFSLFPVLIQLISIVLGLFAGGCVGAGHFELSAADSIDAVSAELATAFDEYHGDLAQYDDERERAAVHAFIARAQQSAADEVAMSAHAEQLTAAMERVHADREVESQRFMNLRDNAAALNEVSAGLRMVAIESSSLDDEMKRYLGDFAKKKNRATKSFTPKLPLNLGIKK